ncbi:MAG: UDP-3-O-acyl-N-acetylglucosamine deacetylase [Chlamydiales bacterium]|nr:UDP-3-O-acyl-N-acetylglucosamine deacetylase [Chlamydiales bacterium]
MKSRPQRTLKKEVSFSGVGIHTGKEVSIRFCPAEADNGIVFQRVDLPGKPTIPAAIEYVQDTSRSTKIGVGSASVQTVEHLLAALYAFQIDNLCVQLDEGEPPVGDGSSLPFVELIEAAGIQEQEADKIVHPLKEPLYYSKGETHLVALPSDEYRISYTLHYPHTPVIRSQYLSLPVNEKVFKSEISMCRTFALYEEITALMERGLIRGGSLENAVVIKDDVVFSKEGLRFSDEMVRHKMLDLIGDLSLVGFPFEAHVIAVRSGHRANVELGKEFVKHFSSY